MERRLSDKVSGVDEKVDTVAQEVKELKGSSIARLNNHDQCIQELQEDRNKLWEKQSETDKKLAVVTSHMTGNPDPQDVEEAFEQAEPYVKKLLKLKIGNMTAKEKLATTGIGGGTALGLIYAILEWGPTIYSILFG